jgi:tetratricopeptide (TPR) repeat protein
MPHHNIEAIGIGSDGYYGCSMADPVFKRFWNAIKPPPPAPFRQWEPEPPPLWSRLWEGIKPPPPVVSVSPEVARRRRLMLAGAGLAMLAAGAGSAAFAYILSAPQRAEAAFQDGRRFAAAGNTAGAIDRFSRAIAIQPRFAAAYLERGLAHQTRLDYRLAMDDCEEALKLNPNLSAAHVARGMVFRSQGNAPHAAAEFTAALAVEQNEDAYYQRGQTYDSLGDHEKAIQDYSAAIALLPDAPYVYRARATAELSRGDREKAARDRERAFAIEHQLTGSPGRP